MNAECFIATSSHRMSWLQATVCPSSFDFNLAREIKLTGPDAHVTVGGTLAYMAPERLLALAEGRFDHVDTRCDLYSLGVVLFDCLVRVNGAFALPSTRSTLTGSLLTSVEARRAMPVRLRLAHPEVPAALEAVVNRCLAPEPHDRYQNAADLAVDLQAVADDAPLRIATEPLPSRSMKWLRRNRRRLTVARALSCSRRSRSHTRRSAPKSQGFDGSRKSHTSSSKAGTRRKTAGSKSL